MALFARGCSNCPGVDAFWAVRRYMSIVNTSRVEGVHLLPRVIQFASTLEADLVGPVVNREYSAELPVTASEENVKHASK